jgi:chorismate--pyruvate lyase
LLLSANEVSHWQPRRDLLHRDVPVRLKPWLDTRDSLTARILRCCPGDFNVNVLVQCWQRPRQDEARLLGLRRGQLAWVREVLLVCDDKPWVFARTVMPLRSLRGRYRRLLRLGNRPLGSALFGRAAVRRGPLELKPLGPRDELLSAWGDPPDGRAILWARRSQLYVGGNKPLLVTEVFLPDLEGGKAYG